MPTTRGAHRDFAALEARRFQAARLFGRGVAQVTVARELGVSRTTTHRWYYAWQAEGRRGLKAVGRAGRKPRLDRQQWAQVEAALLKGPAAHGFATTLWTVPRIAAVIAGRTGVRYHPSHVWRILQGLNWSRQRPARQARERDDAAIAQWRRQRWPQVKKRAAPARLDSLRGRKRRVAASRRAAHVGAARPAPRPAPHRVELETVVDRRRARVSVGWSPHPLVLSNPPGHVYRHDAHPLRARPEATLPRSAGHAHLGWPRCAQESPHGALPRGPAALVAGRTVAGLCPGAQSRRIALG